MIYKDLDGQEPYIKAHLFTHNYYINKTHVKNYQYDIDSCIANYRLLKCYAQHIDYWKRDL